MKQNVDHRAGYRVPDGYFEDFAARMSTMVASGALVDGSSSALTTISMSSTATIAAPGRRFFRMAIATAASIAAIFVISIGIFHYSESKTPMSMIMEMSTDELITSYFGATENDVIDYYYLPSNEDSDVKSSDDILNYISNSGNINVYALLEN